MENERNLSITKGSLVKSVVGDISMSKCNASIQNLSDAHIIDILLRLPAKTIVCCKCVCRDWLNLITDSYFINLHLSNSPECFMVLDKDYEEPITRPISLRLVEIHEEQGHNHLHHDPILSLDLNLTPVFQNARLCAEGSVNGLICLSSSDHTIKKTYICNPITREYMILPKSINDTRDGIYGFGVSLLTSEYKVIRVYRKPSMRRPYPLYAEIYTLGTRQWRCLGPFTYSIYDFSGTFLNYHIHWNFYDRENRVEKICTFDFDNETFQLFPSPPVSLERDNKFRGTLGVLKGCLCYSYYTRTLDVLIRVMKEYGIENSWHKEVLIKQSISPFIGRSSKQSICSPIGCLKDGSILLVYGLLEFGPGKLLVYHPDTNTKEETKFFVVNAFNYRPSFVKLQNFESESVHKFLCR